MLSLFLQSTVTFGENKNASEELDKASQIIEVSLLDLLKFGGWWMIPLLLLFVIAVYIFIERYQLIQQANKNPKDLISEVEANVRAGDIERAKRACESKNTPFARMLLKGLQRLGNPLPDIAAAIENEGKLEVARLEKKVAFLATIAGAAPMLGFLGTVSGMILAFMKISYLEGNVNPSDLAEGIYQAMITTAVGLMVGIPAYVGYNLLTSMIESVIFKMESTTTGFIDLLQEPSK
jgi:biopolymer transport protein ExbB